MRFDRCLASVLHDGLLWLWCVAILQLCRLVLGAILHQQLGPEAGFGAWIAACSAGLRFDGRVALLATAPSLILSLLALRFSLPALHRRLRLGLGIGFAILAALITAVDAGFAQEYGDQFNHFAMQILFDDLAAVLGAVWRQYPVVGILLGLMAFAGLAALLARRLLVRPPWPAESLARLPAWGRGLLVLLLLAGLVVAGRGSVGRLPAQRKSAAVTRDPFLNKLVPTPFDCLWAAYAEWIEVRDPGAVTMFIGDGDVRAAVGRVFSATAAAAADLDAAILRHARGSATAPRHVVLVVGESLSAWTMREPYRVLQLAPRLLDLAREGVLVPRCLSGGTGTMSSLGVLLAGLPDPGLDISYQASARNAYPTALAAIFRRLGYRTRFFYAGPLSWRRLGDFVQAQGFDEVYGAADLGTWIKAGEWGGDDAGLFRFAAERIVPERPSLDVVLTVSNHPPYPIAVYREGYPLAAFPSGLAGRGGASLEVLAHHWYADRCLGRFAERVAALPGSLLVVTGDHYGRRHVEAAPGTFDRLAVPLIFRGAAVEGLPRPRVAGHLDLPATLVERCAPAGFAYHAFGRDLFAGGEELSLGRWAAMGPGFAIDFAGPEDGEGEPDQGALLARYRDLHGLGWWRMVKGPDWP